MPILGHLGDGNLHPGIIFDESDPEETARVKKAAKDLLELGIALGGTLSGEHGIGMEKAPFMSMEHDAFDPNNILNPGKMGLIV
jgi:glycolate oxidase